MRDLRGAFPHGIICDRNLILLICVCPCGVFLYDLERVFTPDGAMRRRDHIESQVKSGDFRQFFCQNRREGIQDIGEVFHRFLIQQALIRLIVEQFLHCVVLAEGVIGKQDIIARHERSHGVRPVKHPHFYEHQLLTVSDIHAVAGLYYLKIPAASAILPFNAFYCVRGAVYRRFRDLIHQRRK